VYSIWDVQAHYQYLLFLRNTFDKAAAGAGSVAGALRLADAMCQESRTLRRVLDIEVTLKEPRCQIGAGLVTSRVCKRATQ
jgi:hypothetical protein